MIKYLKLSLAVEIKATTNEQGVGVWRAESKSLRLTADGQTPDDAVRVLKDAILNAERVSVNDLRVAVFNPVRNVSEIAREEQESVITQPEEKAEEVVEEVVKKKRGRPKKVVENDRENETSGKELSD